MGSNWRQYHRIHVFQKQAKTGKHVYNVENLNLNPKRKFRLHGLQ